MTREEQVRDYIRSGNLGLALVVFRGLDAEAQQRFLANHPPIPDQPHFFRPRKHGSKSACEVCGGRKNDPIHLDRPS